MQEGSTWGTTAGSTFGLDNLSPIATASRPVGDGGQHRPVADKWRAFGWDTVEIDGNDMLQIVTSHNWARGRRGKPR